MEVWDPGEIVRSHIYIRKIYTTPDREEGECLFSSDKLLEKLHDIYSRLGLQRQSEDEIKVTVKLPKNPNPALRDMWHETVLKKTEKTPYVVSFDRLVGFKKREVVLATMEWINSFESKTGDEVIISPSISAHHISNHKGIFPMWGLGIS